MKDLDTFSFTMPATIEKGTSGKWKIRGLASEEVVDRQGEILIAKGMDLTHIDEKRGFINWDHDNSPESTIGLLTGYKRDGKKTYIEGELFQKHDKARAVHSIMESLQENGSNAMGISVEGKILSRNKHNPKIIEKCVIKNVALTLNPVFDKSYAELVKSFSDSSEIVFDANGELGEIGHSTGGKEPKIFSASEVVDLVAKALGVGAGATEAPASRTGGDALAQEDLDKKPKPVDKKPTHAEPEDACPKEDEPKGNAPKVDCPKPKKLKKLSSELYKSQINEIIDKVAILYPNSSREDIWAALKDRLSKKFPELGQNSN